MRNKYDEVKLEFEELEVSLMATWSEKEEINTYRDDESSTIIIDILVVHDDTAVVENTITRKNMRYWDPDVMLPEEDQRLRRAAQRFQGMGEKRFKDRWETLLSTKPIVDVPL